MSPASYRAAPPRVGLLTLAQPASRLQNDPRKPGVARPASGGPPATGRQLLGVGTGADGPTGCGVAVDDAPAAAEAAWNCAIAVSRSFRAWPYFSGSPDAWAVFTAAIALSRFAAACASWPVSCGGADGDVLGGVVLPPLLPVAGGEVPPAGWFLPRLTS